MLTVIVDYDSGNLHSAEKAFQRIAAETDAGQVIVTSDPDQVAGADRVVLPGDGAFPACRDALFAQTGLFDAIEQAVTQQARPFLGICVGMQMMATTGHEYRPTPGFDWISGDIRLIKPDNPNMKVPHMGWNDLIIDQHHPIVDGIKTGDHVYFVHSYHMQVMHTRDMLAHADYGGPITAIVGHENRVGMQFHPEKSQQAGLRMIANFLKWRP
ncbi:imidazole glycerol phosphate synthase subunit HisH [Parasulfitobacter algicola]|uniref:Imidazole glycerol phosphate synthase subunit HisH n=1 Tax=Parasulfitobacter algicola TaxID=2614809 RepID=A0ABX2IUY4_9RHOB|nr:imidazole glycerol phosphate synthase subunit HisH [Sulfitobacter algicola]